MCLKSVLIVLMAIGLQALTFFLILYFEQIDAINHYPKNIFIGVVGGLGVIAIILFALVSVRKSSAGGNKKILKYGRPARAKIVGFGEGGVGKSDMGALTVNEQPYVRLDLEIYDRDKPPYNMIIKRIFPRLQVPQLKIGSMIAIKIDPNNPQNIEMDPEGEGLRDYVDRKDYNEKGITAEDNKVIQEQGISGEAEIIKIEDTGKSEELMPIIEITFQITAPDIEPYKLLSRMPIASEHIEIVRSYVGKKVSAKIHPKEKHEAFIDFDPGRV